MTRKFRFPSPNLKTFLMPGNVYIQYAQLTPFHVSKDIPPFDCIYLRITLLLIQTLEISIFTLMIEINMKHQGKLRVFLPNMIILVTILLHSTWINAQEVGKWNKSFNFIPFFNRRQQEMMIYNNSHILLNQVN